MRHGCIELWNRFLRHWKFEKYKFSHLFLQILFFTTVDSLADVLALCSMTKILEKWKLVMISKFCHLVLKKKMFFENVWEPWKTCDLRKLPICWLHTEQCGPEWKKFPPSALEPHCGGGGIYLGGFNSCPWIAGAKSTRSPSRKSTTKHSGTSSPGPSRWLTRRTSFDPVLLGLCSRFVLGKLAYPLLTAIFPEAPLRFLTAASWIRSTNLVLDAASGTTRDDTGAVLLVCVYV